MNYPATARNEAPRSLWLIIQSGVSALSMILFMYGSAQAQTGPMDSPPIGQSGAEQYKPGKTPTGQEYGVIKKGEPHKSEAAKKKSDGSSEKQETKPGSESIIDRDKRESHEGSGPDPLGRY
ncbi:hypothetical protein [Nitrosospira sp. NpAV]|uniref:hypothetical protein n=1 Tax=Nitrosospira sp. NpAV TaxID=58133 RepID=UPI0005A068EE|nr:hypothetical protein [Nitrosospira sp. NpAV]KIO49992.1 hypothetical protein SQ11_03595 [Nitrosospira sp. NpAV]